MDKSKKRRASSKESSTVGGALIEIMFVGRAFISGKYVFGGTRYPGNFFGGATGRAFPRRKGAFSKGRFPPMRETFSGGPPLRSIFLLGKFPQETMETKRLSTTLPRVPAISLNFMISGSYQQELPPRGGKTP